MEFHPNEGSIHAGQFEGVNLATSYLVLAREMETSNLDPLAFDEGSGGRLLAEDYVGILNLAPDGWLGIQTLDYLLNSDKRSDKELHDTIIKRRVTCTLLYSYTKTVIH
jgi:hypothetical protein